MAFKPLGGSSASKESPEALFRDLKARRVEGLLSQQADVLREYVSECVDEPDVAFELPTGSGKTLVGLLVGEWRRQRFGERVVYLCPTNQLVRQVVGQAKSRYGLDVIGFTGPKSEYDSAAKTGYQASEAIAITSCSALFNVRPFFADPNVIVLDDAHAAENYVAGYWSLEVHRDSIETGATFAAIANLLKGRILPIDHQRLVEEGHERDRWVDKLPTPVFMEAARELAALLDEHALNSTIRFPWSLLRDHLQGCHLYISPSSILLRPLIPPTMTHRPFAGANQRVYMSATLGKGGDLERLTGNKSIRRVAVPAGYERHGIGRRLFFFPDRSLDEVDRDDLTLRLIERAGRALYLVPSDQAASAVREVVETRLGFVTFTGPQLEEEKEAFVQTDRAVAVAANRYDGIDLSGNECRLLIVAGLPRATNLQERFFVERMAAAALLNERVWTRVVQAFGRCTRADTDYATVVVLGEAMCAYLLPRERREILHPELQAELEFGSAQSKGASADDFAENFAHFLTQSDEWRAADREIVVLRDSLSRAEMPGINDLDAAVAHEVEYQYAMWREDYEQAIEECGKVLSKLKDPALRGYRGLWNYLAGGVAGLAAERGASGMKRRAAIHFREAANAVHSVRWLYDAARLLGEVPTQKDVQDARTATLVAGIERGLIELGVSNDRRFSREEKFILENIRARDAKKFEESHARLGRMLGFRAANPKSRGAPDPWWMVDGSLCFVFEDHSDAQPDTRISVTKARQAASHPNWVRANRPIDADGTVVCVIVTPATSVDREAAPHLGGVCYWNIDDFRKWAKKALGVVRELRRTFPGAGDLVWRAEAAERLRAEEMDVGSLVDKLEAQRAADLPTA